MPKHFLIVHSTIHVIFPRISLGKTPIVRLLLFKVPIISC